VLSEHDVLVAQELDEPVFHDATCGGGAPVEQRVDARVVCVAALARGGVVLEGAEREQELREVLGASVTPRRSGSVVTPRTRWTRKRASTVASTMRIS
jgi:hypothetical protein